MPKPHYHIHINHFRDELPKGLSHLISEERFLPRRCDIWEGSGASPLWIVTRKFHSAADAQQSYMGARAILECDRGMWGYIECEQVEPGSVLRFQQRRYTPASPFPVGGLKSMAASRAADIHIFREIDTPEDDLDHRLSDAGFYMVTTQRERIWTLLLHRADAASRIYNDLVRYFRDAGGISKIEMEAVNRLSVLPVQFPVRAVWRM